MVKKNRALKVFSSITASTIVASSLFVGTLGGSTLAPKSAAAATKVPTSFDAGIANDEKLIEMLKREGKLAKNASPAESEKALKTYLKGKSKPTKTKDQLPKGIGNFKESEPSISNGLKNGKGNKLGQAKKNTVDSVQKEPYTDGVRKDKVLVLKIKFPDFANNSIKKEESDMFYEDYTDQHFQNMIFGENGYIGPDGKNYISMKQYYEQQSGGSYSVEGAVAGWYTADHPAAYYGGNVPTPDGSDAHARALVYEALKKAAADPNINLGDYDKWDRDDLDGDGIHAEADGVIDHLMVIHSGVGEEAGGGNLGSGAIWSHRWDLGEYTIVPGEKSESDNFSLEGFGDHLLVALDYTIEPEDGAAGVFSHEFGHDLGLPDEYDTQYTGAGEPVEYWSLMSSGSWAGAIPGTEPPGISPYSRQMLQNLHGGNWLLGDTLKSNEITKAGTTVLLDEAVTKGTNNDAVRVDLPDKVNTLNTPINGAFEYFGGKGDETDHHMSATVDLTSATSASLDFDAWYNIEKNWDYAMVQVSTDDGTTWKSLESSKTSTTLDTNGDPNIRANLPGYTGSSNGWIHETINLSAYIGQKIQLQFRSMTDAAVNLDGFFTDNVKVTADGNEVFFDGAEGASKFTLDGFEKHDGKYTTKHYYLLEWRSHNGVDAGLAHIRRGASLMSYDPGLVVWYVDESYGEDNWTGIHPGEGFLGVVDADQHTTYWSDKAVAATRYQVHDAAFGLSKTDKMFLDYSNIPGFGVTMKDNFSQRNPLFDDSANYSNAGLVDAGRKVPNYGLKFRVVGESHDGTVGKVLIFK